jgi:gas vesicle protein
MSKETGSGGAVIVAFALGALAGAAIALLYAPATGDEMRKKLVRRAREGRDRAEELVREGGEAIKRQGDTIAGAVDSGMAAFERARKESL